MVQQGGTTDIEVIEVNNTGRPVQEGEVQQAVGQGFAGNLAELPVLLEPGDEIEVKFYYTPELDVTQVIRPDGYISMQLVGEVKAEGKTPAELAGELTNRYSWHLKNPQITVIARSLNNRKVYVGGFVTRPGVVPMPGSMTLMEAIVEAGGFDERNANAENVLVVRYENGKRRVYAVNLKPAVQGKPVEPFYLRPKDVVYVPQTRIAKLGQWVEQHINAIVPRLVHIAWYPFDH
jgi:protein involved in polysaccharide export with SLBB domain